MLIMKVYIHKFGRTTVADCESKEDYIPKPAAPGYTIYAYGEQSIEIALHDNLFGYNSMMGFIQGDPMLPCNQLTMGSLLVDFGNPYYRKNKYYIVDQSLPESVLDALARQLIDEQTPAEIKEIVAAARERIDRNLDVLFASFERKRVSQLAEEDKEVPAMAMLGRQGFAKVKSSYRAMIESMPTISEGIMEHLYDLDETEFDLGDLGRCVVSPIQGDVEESTPRSMFAPSPVSGYSTTKLTPSSSIAHSMSRLFSASPVSMLENEMGQQTPRSVTTPVMQKGRRETQSSPTPFSPSL